MWRGLAIGLLLVAGPLTAEAPDRVTRPAARPGAVQPTAPLSRPADLQLASLLPATLDGALPAAALLAPMTPDQGDGPESPATALFTSARTAPLTRPADLLLASAPVTIQTAFPAPLTRPETLAAQVPVVLTPIAISTRTAPVFLSLPRIEQVEKQLARIAMVPTASSPALVTLAAAAASAAPISLAAPASPTLAPVTLAALSVPVTVQTGAILRPLIRPDQGDGGIVLAVVFVQPLRADILRPLTRPLVATPLTATPVALIAPWAPARIIPPVRPDALAADLREAQARVFMATFVPPTPALVSPHMISRALIPARRPEDLIQRVAATQSAPPDEDSPDNGPAPTYSTGGASGGLCGVASIQGQSVGHVSGPGTCGIEDAVIVSSIGGIRMSTGVTITCDTARALARWIDDGAKPAIGGLGGGIDSLQIFGSYACRGRNNQSGARLSEHAFGRAVDIGGINLNDGTRITVLNGWGTSSYGQALRSMHRAACGPFGTVLGPEANRFHRDHFHFDTASYRSGSYCE